MKSNTSRREIPGMSIILPPQVPSHSVTGKNRFTLLDSRSNGLYYYSIYNLYLHSQNRIDNIFTRKILFREEQLIPDNSKN